MNLNQLIQTAKGGRPADVVLANARIVNVFNGDIVKGNIAIKDGIIAGIGDYSGNSTIDMKEKFVAPGFIDAHVHIESAMISPSEFSRTVLGLGTTAVIADPHEIANVMGKDGIEYMLRSAEHQPMDIFFSLPSCVPATHMETSGAIVTADMLAPYFNKSRVMALAEMMNYPGVIHTDSVVLDKLQLAKRYSKPIDGHSPGLSGKNLNAYIAAGISSDHECTSVEEGREKLAAGMHIMIREGTGAKNLKDLLEMINPKTSHRIMWCTDDRHPHDLLNQGSIDSLVREAIRMGLDPVMAIQMATINPSEYFGIRDIGAIGPGRKANLVVFSDLHCPAIETVYSHGTCVAENGHILFGIEKMMPENTPGTMNVDMDKLDFSIPADSNRIHLIEIVSNQIITRHHIETVSVNQGMAVSDTSRDILKCAVIERHQKTGNMGKGFVRGFGLKQGALASSVAHDAHNIVVVGTNDADMKTAALKVIQMGGGLVAANANETKAALPLPIAGLMSMEPIDAVCKQLNDLLAVSRELGTTLTDPFMTLSFLALPVIPEIKLTDMGLVDVLEFKIIQLFEV